MKKNFNLFKVKNLNILGRISLSSVLVISFFYITPMFINFAEKNLNTKEFKNNSKKLLDKVLDNDKIFENDEKLVKNNENDLTKWEDIKHIVISLINDFYSEGKEFVIDENLEEKDTNFGEIERKIVKILDEKIRPAVARDGGDIKFKEFKDGVVKVQLQGSCSGCPSSTMTLKQGVQNLLCHYLPEVKEVVAI